jgi:hypothetical protein
MKTDIYSRIFLTVIVGLFCWFIYEYRNHNRYSFHNERVLVQDNYSNKIYYIEDNYIIEIDNMTGKKISKKIKK